MGGQTASVFPNFRQMEGPFPEVDPRPDQAGRLGTFTPQARLDAAQRAVPIACTVASSPAPSGALREERLGGLIGPTGPASALREGSGGR